MATPAAPPPAPGGIPPPPPFRQANRRVSYVVPFPATLPPLLRIPKPGAGKDFARRGDPRPLIIHHPFPAEHLPHRIPDADHPRHCLGVNALALDLTTALATPSSSSNSSHADDDDSSRSPEGILYTGGKDGLVASWELNLPTRKRRRRYGVYPGAGKGRNGIFNGRRTGWSDGDGDGDGDEELEDGEEQEEDEDESSVEFSQASTAWTRTSRPPPGRRRTSSSGAPITADLPYEETYQVDVERLSTPGPKTKFRQCIQSHTDWCNDLVLCNYNQTVISASSDCTIKAWSPHRPERSMTPTTIGTHVDYVRCLAHSREARWVASGGLDRQIKVWDLSESRSKPIVAFPTHESSASSIYSMATNPVGSVIAVGSPAKVLRLYDPGSKPSPSPLCSLVGHTDNVRSLLVSEDGRWLLSAGSDATVKLWSLAMQRCLHTFTYPSAAVWALWSQHPSLNIFYSGDRAGYVCKVDLEACGDPAEGECLVLCKADEDSSCAQNYGAQTNGIVNGASTTSNCAHDDAVRKIVGVDDAYIWIATGSSTVQRWRDVQPRWLRRDVVPEDLGSSHGGHHISSSPPNASPVLDEFMQPLLSTPSPAKQSTPRAYSSPSSAQFQTILNRPSTPTLSVLGGSLTRTVSGASVAFAEHPTVHPYRGGASPGQPRLPSNATTSPPPSLLSRPTPPVFASSSVTTEPVSPPLSHGLPLESLVPLFSADDVLRSTFLGSRRGIDSMADPDTGASIHSTYSLVRTWTNLPGQVGGVASSTTTYRPHGTGPASIDTIDRDYRKSFDEDAMNNPAPAGSMHTKAHAEAWHLFRLRELESEAAPYRDVPDGFIEGRAGLVKSELLNDRRHVVTIDTAGQLALWDIVLARCVGYFKSEDLWNKSTNVSEGNTGDRTPSAKSDVSSNDTPSVTSSSSPMEMLAVIRERIEGQAAVAHWCSVDTQTGLLTVHLEESRCFDAEVYADEADIAEPLSLEMKDDHRLSYGRWILRNLFNEFINHEVGWTERQDSQAAPSPNSGSSSLTSRSRRSSLIEIGSRLQDRSQNLHVQLPNSFLRRDSRSNSGIPRTPGMTIALATPALTPVVRPVVPPMPTTRNFGDLTPIAGSPHTAAMSREVDNANTDYFSLAASQHTAVLPSEEGEKTTNGFSSEAGSSKASLGTPTASTPATPTQREGILPRDNDVPLHTSNSGIFSRWKTFGRGPSSRKILDKTFNEPATTIDLKVAPPPIEAPSPTTTTQVTEPLIQMTMEENFQFQMVQSILSKPIQPCGILEAPPIELVENVAILVSEESRDTGVWEVTYRGLQITTGEDSEMLKRTLPSWLMEFCLGNRTILKEANKIPFILEPHEGKLRCGLDELPSGNARLTASKVLRMRKAAVYVSQKLSLDFAPPELGSPPLPTTTSNIPTHLSLTHLPSASRQSLNSDTVAVDSGGGDSASQQQQRRNLVAEEEIELLCNGKIVPWTMTLGAVKQFIWTKGGDVVIGYRLRSHRELSNLN